MTIAEFIARLRELPQDAEVLCWEHDNELVPAHPRPVVGILVDGVVGEGDWTGDRDAEIQWLRDADVTAEPVTFVPIDWGAP